MDWDKHQNVTSRKKRKFPRFPSFCFYTMPKIENSEISRDFLLLQILAVVETLDSKTTTNELRQKRKRYDMKDLRFKNTKKWTETKL